jgi:glycerate kinase
MKVIIAIDSFKGSISSIEAGNCAKEGVERVYKQQSKAIQTIWIALLILYKASTTD